MKIFHFHKYKAIKWEVFDSNDRYGSWDKLTYQCQKCGKIKIKIIEHDKVKRKDVT